MKKIDNLAKTCYIQHETPAKERPFKMRRIYPYPAPVFRTSYLMGVEIVMKRLREWYAKACPNPSLEEGGSYLPAEAELWLGGWRICFSDGAHFAFPTRSPNTSLAEDDRVTRELNILMRACVDHIRKVYADDIPFGCLASYLKSKDFQPNLGVWMLVPDHFPEGREDRTPAAVTLRARIDEGSPLLFGPHAWRQYGFRDQSGRYEINLRKSHGQQSIRDLFEAYHYPPDGQPSTRQCWNIHDSIPSEVQHLWPSRLYDFIATATRVLHRERIQQHPSAALPRIFD